jgi:aldehyde:ferredoxin oxidoreductase|tara:strand:- start:157 stop:2031 length:1875 start_codon:yes stop_codon:yes gene_type:complete
LFDVWWRWSREKEFVVANGYMGKFLDVDLTKQEFEDLPLSEELTRDYIGGYGIGVKILYDRMKPNVDALGPDNILGLLTGPMTGTPCIEGNRFVAVCKSPLTGTWGDANCGGTFGPHMKFAGYDGLLFTGIAEEPTYLLIEDGEASLHDASDLWGMDSNETEDILIERHGRGTQVATIGQAGENQSLIACIMNDKGRAAGRSGVGAVMGSKKLKAVVVKGKAQVPIPNISRARDVRRRMLKEANAGLYDFFHETGTLGLTSPSAMSGDSPVKNWGGSGMADFEEGFENYKEENIMPLQSKRYGCWRCSLACGGHMKATEGPYKGVAHHKPEYETAASFGTMTLSTDIGALIKANEQCNRYGLDTISAGCTIAFVIECFENNIITLEDTDGIPMNWGNVESIVAMTDKLALREGFGDVIADGVKVAAERIGRGSEEYAIHVQGQELPMHDPRLEPALATTYTMDATPGRHTQGHEGGIPGGLDLERGDKYDYTGKGDAHRITSALMHTVNSAGICQFGYMTYGLNLLTEFMTVISGEEWDADRCVEAGERIGTLRHMFNLREGLNPAEFDYSPRMVRGMESGNLRGVDVDIKTLQKEYMEAADWDTTTARPSDAKLDALGLGFAK